MYNINPGSYRPNLMSLISHELRIPLTGILGMAYLLKETTLNHEQKEYLKDIIISAEHLLSIEGKLYKLLSSDKKTTHVSA